jgi:hypothetical protein
MNLLFMRVTIDGVGIDGWIYGPLTGRNYWRNNYNIVACFLGNATIKFTWVSHLWRLWTFPLQCHNTLSHRYSRRSVSCSAPSSIVLSPLSDTDSALLRVKIKVTLRLTVSQSVCLSWCRAPAGAHDQLLLFKWNLLSCPCGAPSLTRGRVSYLLVFC